MGRRMDWAALPVLTELFDVDDAERLIHQLFAIQDHLTRKAKASG